MSKILDVKPWLERTERRPPAVPGDIDSLVQWAPAQLPADYLDCLLWSDGLEGFVGGRGYLVLWSATDVVGLNEAYRVRDFLPGLILFGTDAAGVGFGFDLASLDTRVVQVELMAMHRDYVGARAASFLAFVRQLAHEPLANGAIEPDVWGPPDHLRGKVIHEKQPVVLGGNPSDPDNQMLVPREKHPELAIFWTKVVREMKAQDA